MEDYRQLTSEELTILENNSCWAEDWSRVLVAENFKPYSFHRVMFYGDIRLGEFNKQVEVSQGFFKHSGINDATLRNVTVGNDCLIEKVGNYINNYICQAELEREWAKRSTMGLYDTTQNDYTVYPTLLRYLNALGTTKDSVGMTLLGDDDIRAIEHGIANPVYVSGSSLRKMYYVMFFEYECYRSFGAVKDFTMLQRFELWRNAWKVFRSNPLFGTGTGDVVDACHQQLADSQSPLQGTYKHAHNQYLTFLVTFGIIGFAIITAFFVYALRRQRLLRVPAVLAFVCIVLISFITEDTLETLAGCVFSTLFLCLMAAVEAENVERRAESGKRKAMSRRR